MRRDHGVCLVAVERAVVRQLLRLLVLLQGRRLVADVVLPVIELGISLIYVLARVGATF